jgi:hypothetical protein
MKGPGNGPFLAPPSLLAARRRVCPWHYLAFVVGWVLPLFLSCNPIHYSTTGPDAAHPHEVYIEAKAFEYAKFLNVNILVNFGKSPVNAGWVSCGAGNPAVVNFNAYYIDGYDDSAASYHYFDELAAHECCHVYYKDYTCKESGDRIEKRANDCGALVVKGVHP